MLTLADLNTHMLNHCLPAPIESEENYLSFVVQNERGEIRMGRLDLKKRWYEEISNFQTAPTAEGVDYCDPDCSIPGLYRFFSDAEEDLNVFLEDARKCAQRALDAQG